VAGQNRDGVRVEELGRRNGCEQIDAMPRDWFSKKKKPLTKEQKKTGGETGEETA
jgi:hypothetical protein